MKNHDFKELVDRTLSELVWDERKRQKTLYRISEEEKPVRKFSTTFVLAAVVLCVSITALAAGLLFSANYEVGKTANEALKTQYGITADLLGLFYRTIETNGDGTATVTYSVPSSDFPADQMGVYTVQVKGSQAAATWSNDGKNTEGGLLADAFGAEQLHLLSHDYGRSMQTLRDSGKLAPKASASATPNPRLQGEVVWTEADQAEADKSEAEFQAAEAKRLAAIEKAESTAKYRVEDAAKAAREAIVQEYALSAAQQEKLLLETDSSTYITYQNDRPVVNLLFWLWQDETGAFTEKDGQYWVSVHMDTLMIEEILYDAALAGNG